MAQGDSNPGYTSGYQDEVERLRELGVVGRTGRLRELFDYLADRGPDSEPASQQDIAAAVFRQVESEADDATVRVYVHRLRKKIEDHYARQPKGSSAVQLEIPSGIYALRPLAPVQPEIARGGGVAGVPPRLRWAFAAAALALLLVVFFAGRWLGAPPSANAIWQPLLTSERPVLLVLGDYYIFGEYDYVRPEESRLIRDFRVNSAEDLLRLQEAEPERYGAAEDVGLNYLPFASAYALSDIAPLLRDHGKAPRVIAASELTPDMLNTFDVVYVGLLSGLGVLQEQTFAGSGFRIGETFDELVDRETRRIYASDEARRVAAPVFYRDYAYLARFTVPGGALVTVVASERDTGLRSLGPLAAEGELAGQLAQVAGRDASFEALFEVTGQQGADLSERLVLARGRK